MNNADHQGMNMGISDALAYVTETSIIIAAVAWLTRSIINFYLSKDIETYKQKLSNSSEIQIENLKHSLRIIAVTHEKRVSLLHERRARIIAKMYKLLVKFVASAESLPRRVQFEGEADKNEQVIILSNNAYNFYNFFNINRIYFSEDTCIKIDELFKGIWKSSSDLGFWLHMRAKNQSEPEHLSKAWDKAGEFIQKELPPLLGVVEREFRKILGVDELKGDDSNGAGPS